jgi:hypothetical protein
MNYLQTNASYTTFLINLIILTGNTFSVSVLYFSLIQWTLEITEVAIKNGQSRETGNIGYIGTQDVEKQNPTQGKHAHVM